MGVGFFEQAVCQRALAVVDVGYDAEVADVFHKSHKNVCKYTKYFGFTEGAVAHRAANCAGCGNFFLIICGLKYRFRT